MTRNQIVTYAKRAGWREWGQLKKEDGSSYQCFRRGNAYCWIGFRYVQHPNDVIDFVADPEDAKALLRGQFPDGNSCAVSR